jgi:hypothetical protein
LQILATGKRRNVDHVGQTMKLPRPRGRKQLRAEVQVRVDGPVVTHPRQHHGGSARHVADYVGFELSERREGIGRASREEVAMQGENLVRELPSLPPSRSARHSSKALRLGLFRRE